MFSIAQKSPAKTLFLQRSFHFLWLFYILFSLFFLFDTYTLSFLVWKSWAFYYRLGGWITSPRVWFGVGGQGVTLELAWGPSYSSLRNLHFAFAVFSIFSINIIIFFSYFLPYPFFCWEIVFYVFFDTVLVLFTCFFSLSFSSICFFFYYQ